MMTLPKWLAIIQRLQFSSFVSSEQAGVWILELQDLGPTLPNLVICRHDGIVRKYTGVRYKS